MSQPYLNEPVAEVLQQELSAALLTAQAMAENAISSDEQIPAVIAFALHQQLVEIERCICQSLGMVPILNES